MMDYELTQDDLDRANAVRARRGWSLLTWAQADGAVEFWCPDLSSLHMFLVRLIPTPNFVERRNVR